MRVDEILQRLGASHSVRRVFGEPVERDGVTVIPVAMVMGGAGVGVSPDEATGTGYGIWARGIGVYTIRDGEVRFVPATDRTLLAVAAAVLGAGVLRRWGRRGRRPAGRKR